MVYISGRNRNNHYLASMKRFGIVAIAAILMAGEAEGQTSALERATPESQGVPSEAVVGWFDSLMNVDATEIHGAMLLRHGKVIGEMHPKPFRAEYGHTLFSCSKVFTAAAIGIAVGENRLRVSDRVATFFPELLPDSIGDWLAKLTIRDLLTMQSGFEPTNAVRTKETEWVKKCLGGKMVAQPGEKFAYDSMNTYLLSAIISRVTGEKMVDYLRPRLFEPMGIEPRGDKLRRLGTVPKTRIDGEDGTTAVGRRQMGRPTDIASRMGEGDDDSPRGERRLRLSDMEMRAPRNDARRRRTWAVYNRHARRRHGSGHHTVLQHITTRRRGAQTIVRGAAPHPIRHAT